MSWKEYADGWSSTYSGGAVGYMPSLVQSVHDGVLDWALQQYNGVPVSANPSPLPGGNRYQTYGRYSICERLAPADSTRLRDFYQALLLWPYNESQWQCAESDFPEGNLSRSSFDAFAHYGCSGSQDSFNTATLDPTQWHVYTQEWGPGFRNYYVDGTLVGTTTSQVYSSTERWQLQIEPSGQNDGMPNGYVYGHVYAGWAAIWTY
jgi:beta-glucanase (GH16 family)